VDAQEALPGAGASDPEDWEQDMGSDGEAEPICACCELLDWVHLGEPHKQSDSFKEPDVYKLSDLFKLEPFKQMGELTDSGWVCTRKYPGSGEVVRKHRVEDLVAKGSEGEGFGGAVSELDVD